MKAYLDVLHKFWDLKMSPFFWHMLTHYNNMKHIHIGSRTKGFFPSFNHWFLVPLLRLQTLKWSTPSVLSYAVQFGVCVWHRRISQQSEQQKFCPGNSSLVSVLNSNVWTLAHRKIHSQIRKSIKDPRLYFLLLSHSLYVQGLSLRWYQPIIFNQSASLYWKFFRGKQNSSDTLYSFISLGQYDTDNSCARHTG